MDEDSAAFFFEWVQQPQSILAAICLFLLPCARRLVDVCGWLTIDDPEEDAKEYAEMNETYQQHDQEEQEDDTAEVNDSVVLDEKEIDQNEETNTRKKEDETNTTTEENEEKEERKGLAALAALRQTKQDRERERKREKQKRERERKSGIRWEQEKTTQETVTRPRTGRRSTTRRWLKLYPQ